MWPKYRTSLPKKAPLEARPSLDRGALIAEARRFGRYLVDEVPPRQFVYRYVAAHEARWEDLLVESPALAAVRRRPSLLPWLDAACAVAQPDDPLRRKLLLMTAVLECSPVYADLFLPRDRSRPAIAWELLVLGVTSGVRIAGGLLIYQWVLKRAMRDAP